MAADFVGLASELGTHRVGSRLSPRCAPRSAFVPRAWEGQGGRFFGSGVLPTVFSAWREEIRPGIPGDRGLTRLGRRRCPVLGRLVTRRSSRCGAAALWVEKPSGMAGWA